MRPRQLPDGTFVPRTMEKEMETAEESEEEIPFQFGDQALLIVRNIEDFDALI